MSGTRYGVILAAMRTGSNLLEALLAHAPEVRSFGEAFNPAFVGAPGRSSITGWSREQRDADPLAALCAMTAEAADAGQVALFRLFPDHDPIVRRHVLADPDAVPIRLSRGFAESFVSLLIARQTGQWILRSGETRRFVPVDVDIAAFRRYCADRLAANTEIDRAVSATGRRLIEVHYDDMAASGMLTEAFAALGATPPSTIAATILRQNPEPLWQKVRNYAAFAEALGAPPAVLDSVAEPRIAIAGRLGLVTTGCALSATAVLFLELLRANTDEARPRPAGLAARTLRSVPIGHRDVDRVVLLRQTPETRANRLFERDVLGRSGLPREDVRHWIARRSAPLADALIGDRAAIEQCRVAHRTLFTSAEDTPALTDYATFDHLVRAVHDCAQTDVAIVDEPDLPAFAERMLRPGQVARLCRKRAEQADFARC